MPPLVAALRALGCRGLDAFLGRSRHRLVEFRPRAAALDLGLRRTHRRVPALGAGAVARVTTLLNPPDVVAWNTDKHYLVDAGRGRRRRGADAIRRAGRRCARAALEQFLAGGLEVALRSGSAANFDEFVVKPSVGAGSRDAARYRRADHDAAARAPGAPRRRRTPQCHAATVPRECRSRRRDGDDVHRGRGEPRDTQGTAPAAGQRTSSRASSRRSRSRPASRDSDERRLAAAAYAAIPFAAAALCPDRHDPRCAGRGRSARTGTDRAFVVPRPRAGQRRSSCARGAGSRRHGRYCSTLITARARKRHTRIRCHLVRDRLVQ